MRAEKVFHAVTLISLLCIPHLSAESIKLFPDGPGSLTQLTSSTGNPNWTNEIEDPADDDRSYNRAHNSVYKLDLYNTETVNLPPGVEITKVRVYVRGMTSTDLSQCVFFKPFIQTHGYLCEGDAVKSKFWATAFKEWTSNPHTLQPWKPDEIDDLQIGAYCAAGNYETTKITHCYAVIYYATPPVSPTPYSSGENTAIWRPVKYDARCHGGIGGFESSGAGALWENLDEEVADDDSSYNYSASIENAANAFFTNGPDIPDNAAITNVALNIRYRAGWLHDKSLIPIVIPYGCGCSETDCQWQVELGPSAEWTTARIDMPHAGLQGRRWTEDRLQKSSFGYRFSMGEKGDLIQITQMYIVIRFTVAPVVINEILYDYPGNDSGNEFIELYNGGDSAVDLSFCKIQASRAGVFKTILTIPRGKRILPHEHFLIGGSYVTGASGRLPDVRASIMMQNGDGGGKLSDTDGVRLVGAGSVVWDTVLYDEPNSSLCGDNSGPGETDELCPDVAEGHSLSRKIAGADTNRKEDFEGLSAPSPTSSSDPDTDNDGLTNAEELICGTDPLDADSDDDGFVDGSEVMAHTNPLSAASRPHVKINEVYYDPPGADDKLRQEFIELYNAEPYPVAIGWLWVQYGGKFDYAKVAIPLDAVIPAKGYYLIGDSGVEGHFGVRPDFVNRLKLQNGDQNDPSVPYYGNLSPSDGVRLVGCGRKVHDTLLYNSPNSYNLPGDRSSPAGTIELCADVQPGRSLSRKTPGLDTDSKSDWEELPSPSPANSGWAPAPTPTPEPTPTPSPPPTETPAETPTETPTWTATVTRTPTRIPTVTHMPTETPTDTPTATLSPTDVPTHTPAPTPFPLSDSAWPITKRDVFRRGQSEYNGPQSFSWAWTHRVNGADEYIWSSPVITRDSVYYTTSYYNSNYGTVYCYSRDGETHSLRWSYNFGPSPALGTLDRTSPAIDSSDRCYFGSHNASDGASNLWCLGCSGQLLWSYRVKAGGNWVQAGIDIDNNVIAAAGDLYCITGDGSLRWSYDDANDRLREEVALDEEGRIYVGSADNRMYSFSSSGVLTWSYTTTAPTCRRGFAIGRNTAYCGSGANDWNLYALRKRTGRLRWTYSLTHVTDGSTGEYPSVDTDDNVYAGEDGGWRFNCILSTGRLSWSYMVDGSANYGPRHPPVIGANRDSYFISGNGRSFLWCLNSSGRKVWSQDLGAVSHVAPAFTERGQFYITGQYQQYMALVGPTAHPTSTPTTTPTPMDTPLPTSTPKPDTDGDGWKDEDELAAGTNPHDPMSFPSPDIVVFLPTEGCHV